MGPPWPQFDAGCVLKGINSHVQALKDELARSSARNDELAKSRSDLAASFKLIETAASGGARGGDELAALQGRYDEL